MRLASLFVVCLFVLTPTLQANDWPQWRGPDRNGISQETGLLKSWPKDGPKLLWTYTSAGTGYSGPAVVGDRLYTLGADEKVEFLCALDVAKGQKVWSLEIGTRLKNGYGDGPRGTPAIDGNFVYAISGEGNLVCVERNKGEKVWSVSMTKDLGGSKPGWGFTESPLVDGKVVVCTPGGKMGTFAALDKKTGKVIWRSSGVTDAAQYSSILIVNFKGIKQYVNMTKSGVVGVAALDGRKLWTSPEAKNGTAIVPTPVYHDGLLFVTSGYGAGCALLKLIPDGDGCKVENVYVNKNMVNHHGGVCLVGDHLYGYSDGKGWVCMDFNKGTIAWQNKTLAKGSMTYADGHFYCYGEDGVAVLIEANTMAWKETGRFTIPEKTKVDRQRGRIWTHPVIANGRLYLRDQDLLFCFDVKGS